MKLLRWVFWVLTISAARAVPLEAGRRQEDHSLVGNDGVGVGEPASDRTVFVMVALVCMGLMCFLLGLRFGKLKRSILMKRNIMSILVLIIWILVLVLIILSTVLVSGQGMFNFQLCKAGTWVCLVLYCMTKLHIFLFLVERVHVVRAPFKTRREDKIYIGCLATVMILFGPVVINSLVDPVTKMDSADGRCRFGIRGDASIPTLAVNSVVDLVLTGVFFYLLYPIVKSNHAQSNETSVQRNIRTLLWKSIIGSLLIELPMMANMIQFVITRGEELGMICLTICVIELVWDALIVYWLAFGSSAQAERELERSTAASSQVALTQARNNSILSKRSCEKGTKDPSPIDIDVESASITPLQMLGDTPTRLDSGSESTSHTQYPKQ